MLQITPLERAALQLLAKGKPSDEIAGCLGISECTVEARLTALFARMGAPSRIEAIAAAFRRGLLTSDDQRPDVRASAPYRS
jgi:DNA-binding CsgD family transcriptional regulator